MLADIDTLPPLVFGEPGEFRELMVALVMSGDKTGSSNLRVAYELTADPLPEVGTEYALVDSAELSAGGVESGARAVRLNESLLQRRRGGRHAGRLCCA